MSFFNSLQFFTLFVLFPLYLLGEARVHGLYLSKCPQASLYTVLYSRLSMSFTAVGIVAPSKSSR